MNDVTRILSAIDKGDPSGAAELLPLVYQELRHLASVRLAREKPGQTLQATALVHEAYLRLVGNDDSQRWDGRGHFFAAAAEAMRRILVDNARRRQSLKRGGDADQIQLDELLQPAGQDPVDLLTLDEALTKLAESHPVNAQIVKLRYFGGCTLEETAEMLGLSRANTERKWAYARAWLFGQLNAE
jgi:RNA polymerase sigma factor (TIGR02999 family)